MPGTGADEIQEELRDDEDEYSDNFSEGEMDGHGHEDEEDLSIKQIRRDQARKNVVEKDQ